MQDDIKAMSDASSVAVTALTAERIYFNYFLTIIN